MDEVQTAKAPIHLWIVGFLALLWNAFGCYDYVMTRMRNLDYFRSMAPDVDPNAMLAWVDGFPIYAQFGWGLGVWMGLIGSVLLLMRHRWAVPALGLSLLGALLGLGYQILAAPPPPPPMDSDPVMSALAYVIIIVAALLFFYAHRQQKAGVLREALTLAADAAANLLAPVRPGKAVAGAGGLALLLQLIASG